MFCISQKTQKLLNAKKQTIESRRILCHSFHGSFFLTLQIFLFFLFFRFFSVSINVISLSKKDKEEEIQTKRDKKANPNLVLFCIPAALITRGRRGGPCSLSPSTTRLSVHVQPRPRRQLHYNYSLTHRQHNSVSMPIDFFFRAGGKSPQKLLTRWRWRQRCAPPRRGRQRRRPSRRRRAW